MAHRNLRIAELRPKHNPTKKELPAHDARAFYRAAVDAHSLGRGVPDHDAFFASVSRKGPSLAAASKSSTWNPPEPPAPGPDGVVPQEAQAEFIHSLFAYMHNLHHQKVSAYEKLEAALNGLIKRDELPALLRGLRDRVPSGATGQQANERRQQRAQTIGSVLKSTVSIVLLVWGILAILNVLGVKSDVLKIEHTEPGMTHTLVKPEFDDLVQFVRGL